MVVSQVDSGTFREQELHGPGQQMQLGGSKNGMGTSLELGSVIFLHFILMNTTISYYKTSFVAQLHCYVIITFEV